MKKKYIYFFNEGNIKLNNILGGKGANLAEMTQIGISVPKGFTITVDACISYYKNGHIINKFIIKKIKNAIKELSIRTKKNFGSINNPLLLSVRSGAEKSMPGMMDTILNLGLNDEIVKIFNKKNPFQSYDLYRRLIQMYGNIVKNIPMKNFDKIYNKYNKKNDLLSIFKIIKEYKKLYFKKTNENFEQNVFKQLYNSIEAIFKSWNNERAIYYRHINNITGIEGTAVNIQEMVFGNKNKNSATGVCFTRNPANGKKELYGEILFNAQGEDIVAGTHTPKNIKFLKKKNLKNYKELKKSINTIEKHYKDMQDIEFTIENKKLFILQTRNGKRTSQATLKIINDLINEKIITINEGLKRINLSDINNCLYSNFDKNFIEKKKSICKGLPASPGCVTGKIVFSKQKVIDLYNKKVNTIMIRSETSAEDIEGMHLAKGIITSKGGITSHASVVARGMGKTCIVGCKEIIFIKNNKIKIGKKIFNEKDIISINGNTGKIYEGTIPLEKKNLNNDLIKLLNYAKKHQEIGVFENSENQHDIKNALLFKADGIGLARTEHMFFKSSRTKIFQKVILSNTEKKRKINLNKLLPLQKKDFKKIFLCLKTLPVIIRLLDPPLHEFMPKKKNNIIKLAKKLNCSYEYLKNYIKKLNEYNPMLGHRGCRLAISYPEIYTMQTKALVESIIEVEKKIKKKIKLNIMLPLISEIKEFKYLKNHIKKIIKKYNYKIKYSIGAMIEVPRACLIANKIAKYSDFLSFGTNDLTQMTYGISRDDTSNFFHDYFDKKIYSENPFEKLDLKGVGNLIKIAVKKARKTKPKIKIGICGEQTGDKKSINFFKKIKINYVSCSPFKIPAAILMAMKKK